MGVDIYGWVEINLSVIDQWSAVVDIGPLIDRNYDAFGCLFGVLNYANFDPIAPDRGIPSDASTRVQADIAEAASSAQNMTWISWQELQAIDWEEPAVYPDRRLHVYERDIDGTPIYINKSVWNSRVADHIFPNLTIDEVHSTPSIFREGQEWEFENKIYRAETLKRSDAIGNDWKLLFRIMEVLAEAHGAENVRLVVWFSW